MFLALPASAQSIGSCQGLGCFAHEVLSFSIHYPLVVRNLIRKHRFIFGVRLHLSENHIAVNYGEVIEPYLVIWVAIILLGSRFPSLATRGLDMSIVIFHT